jgi:hypothetical protein
MVKGGEVLLTVSGGLLLHAFIRPPRKMGT